MIFLYFLEYIFIALFCLTMVTQVVWPLLMDQKSWPLFRRRKLEAKLTDLNDQLAADALAEEVRRRGRELNHQRQHKESK